MAILVVAPWPPAEEHAVCCRSWDNLGRVGTEFLLQDWVRWP